MYYALLDSTGNLIESFDSREQALDELHRIADANPDATGDVAMLTYDDDGEPVGDAVVLDASGSAATRR